MAAEAFVAADGRGAGGSGLPVNCSDPGPFPWLLVLSFVLLFGGPVAFLIWRGERERRAMNRWWKEHGGV